MLRVKRGSNEFAVFFKYDFLGSDKLLSLTGKHHDGPRRCCMASVTMNGVMRREATSVCHPSDNFRKSVGRKNALRLALADVDVEIRTAIWEEYAKHCKF